MDAFEEDPSSAIDNKEYNIMDLPEEMLLKILSYLSPTEALWNLGFVCTSFLPSSHTYEKLYYYQFHNEMSRSITQCLLHQNTLHFFCS